MEPLIFGIASLIMILLFVGISLLPAFAGYWLGRLTPFPSMRWILPILIIVIPVAWAFTSYWTFKKNCSIIPKTEFFSFPKIQVEGISVIGDHIQVDNLIDRNAFLFVETQGSDMRIKRYFSKGKQSRMSEETEWMPTNYAVTELKKQPVAYWWSPPIFTQKIEIKEKKTGVLLARATELIFGGGILGEYLRFFGGDQDFELLSCGYASNTIGPWRPTLANRPQYQHYLDADLNFLVKALKSTNVK